MKTSRLTVLMTPKEKRALAARARRAGLSASEYVRRTVSQEVRESRASAEAALGSDDPLLRGPARDGGADARFGSAGRPDRAFDELMAREDVRLEALRAYLREGRDAIARGEGVALDDAAAIGRFFEKRKRAR